MRSFAILAAISGIALLTGLTVYYGFDEVMAAIASSRWATALVVAARARGAHGRRHWLVGSCAGSGVGTFGFRAPAVRPRRA